MSQSYVYSTRTNFLLGAAVQSAPWLAAVDSTVRDEHIAAGFGTAFDRGPGGMDLASLGLAKTAAVLLTCTGSTPITLDLTALAAATGVQVAGSSSFGAWSHILATNIGSQPIAIAPGASNPLRTALTGTTPAHTVQAGDCVHWNNAVALAVDSTHKTLTFTPTSGGSLTLWIGGQ